MVEVFLPEAGLKQHQYRHQRLRLRPWCSLQTAIAADTVDTTPTSPSNVSLTATASFPHRRTAADAAADAVAAATYGRPETLEVNTA
jgi:hypothetical protein